MHSTPASAAVRSGELGATRAKSSRRVRVPTKAPFARVHLSKNSRMSVTRSRMIGKCASGAIRTVLPLTTFATCVRHVHRGVPLTDIAHDPHIPTRHAKVGQRGIQMPLDICHDI